MYRAFWRGMPEEASWAGVSGHRPAGDKVFEVKL